ncbi:MAG: hypothetical protein PWQ79_95 [Thermococcaceae archaeon]|nr:hypothetical protein [Thermococcaceae archaeon]MDK2913180.1 hypothetical protein [Thermococcaceae archaeon]
MRRSTKKKIMPLALALVLAIIGAALAVPTINVSVQELGQGSKVIASSVSAVDVKWTMDSSNPDYVAGATVTVTGDPGSGTLYLKLYDGNTLVNYYTINLDGSGTYNVNFGNSVSLDSFDTVYVVYQGQ